MIGRLRSIEAPLRIVHPFLAVALVLAAIVGYKLAGRQEAAQPTGGDQPPAAARSLTRAGLLIEYPISWTPASAVRIPRLVLDEATALAPPGDPAEGLLMGRVPAGSPAPLPGSFLAGLSAPPAAEVVDLSSSQAFRYSNVAPRGYAGSLDIYAIPSTVGATRLLVCFARQRLTPVAQSCERAVAAVTPIGSQTPSLTPEPVYARALSGLVDSVQQSRVAARRKMAVENSPAVVSQLAAGLSSKLSSAAGSVAALQGPQLMAPADSSFAEALRQAAHAYTDLSFASADENVPSYDAARDEVSSAERDLGTALENFTLLGYGRAPAG